MFDQIAYQREYIRKHRAECAARSRAHYKANKDEINERAKKKREKTSMEATMYRELKRWIVFFDPRKESAENMLQKMRDFIERVEK